jgi:D-aspartate ligase
MPTLSESASRSQVLNPGRAEPDWPPAVIAGAFQTGVLGVRSLIRRGVRACCFDCHLDYPGFRSVYGPAHACPDPDIDAPGWVKFMISLAGKMEGRPVLIPSADQFVSAIAAHADILTEHYVLSPGIRLQGLLATKQTQYALAAEHGMPLPQMKLVHAEDDVRDFARDAQFPCLLKPLHFREWQVFPDGHPLSHEKVAIAKTPEALLAAWRLAATVNPSGIVQEIIEGPDTAKRVYVSCYDRGGHRIASAMFRELRCEPVRFGTATVSEPVVDAETDEVCDRWLRKLGYAGVCEIEMKRDSRDGQVKMIEANPRLTGGGDAAPYAGVDVCWLHYLDLIGKPVIPVAADGRDFRHVVLRPDLRTIIKYRKAGLISWADVVRSYKPPLAFYDLDPRDWRYSAETMYLTLRSGVGELVRSVWPRLRAS